MPGHTNFLQIRLALLSPQVMGYTISASKFSPSSAIFTSHRHMTGKGRNRKSVTTSPKHLLQIHKAGANLGTKTEIKEVPK
jgi:hypothetical protein